MNSTPPTDGGLTYKAAGVDIEAGNSLVERIKPWVKRTHRPGVVGGLGGFGGLFELPVDRYKRPLLVSGTDGVGTKLRLAIESGRHDGIGTDLVAMCVNDIIVAGAEPLFFLDYYATGHLDVDLGERIVAGIARGCEQAGCALIGGETAEMPGMYEGGDYDLAGFSVGVVEKDEVITGDKVVPGDRLIGIASSGPHSNGYSLIRKLLEISGDTLETEVEGVPLVDLLMAPTRIYVRPLLRLIAGGKVHALAHITGGGLPENLPRVLPEGCGAHIDTDAWPLPAVFRWAQGAGNIAPQELLRVLNCGIGMVVVVPPEAVDDTLATLFDEGEVAWEIGGIVAGGHGVGFSGGLITG